MKTVTEHIRHRLLERAGLIPQPLLPPLEQLRETEWCSEFEQLMRNRLILGAFRYGLFSSNSKTAWRMMDSIHKRLSLYSTDGNLEHLVDAANLLMLEYLKGIRAGQRVRSVDDGEHVESL